MQFSRIFLAFTAAALTSAIPIEGSTSVQTPRDALHILEGRADIKDVTCKGVESTDAKKWEAKDIRSSYKAGKGNVKSDDGSITDSSKVKEFKNKSDAVLKDMPSECKAYPSKDGQLYEYRLKGSNTDRVIWAWKKDTKSQFFCMVITHRGKDGNDFKACT